MSSTPEWRLSSTLFSISTNITMQMTKIGLSLLLCVMSSFGLLYAQIDCTQFVYDHEEYKACKEERGYFSRFSLPFAKQEPFFNPWVNKEPTTLQLYDTLSSLLKKISEYSSDKNQMLQVLENIFTTCAEQKGVYAEMCQYFREAFIGTAPRQSSLTLSELLRAFATSSRGIKRTGLLGDFIQHYPLLRYPHAAIQQIVGGEYGIGEYLFGLAYASTDTNPSGELDYWGIRILRAGDTHWQEFAVLDTQNLDDEYTINRLALDLKKKRLFTEFEILSQNNSYYAQFLLQ